MIFVDNPIFKGRCHLVSDESLDELHVFADDLGIRHWRFHKDHYDLTPSLRFIAINSGASPVSSRLVLGALKKAGLR